MRVRRTPHLNSDRKPLGVSRKQFSCPPPPSIKKPVSLEFFGGCTVLSINPSNSILSEKALQAFKYAFLRNQKIGIGSLPSAEEPSKIELDKATAAYEIARELVDWSEQICVEDDDAMPDLDGNEAEHRSCDVKKDDSLFGISSNTVDDPSNHPEAKDLSLDFSPELKSKFIENSTGHSIPDLKLTGPLLEPFLDNMLAPSTPCEGMDFFGSPSLDDLCENQLKWDSFGKVDRVDVDISFSGVEDTVPFLHDSDNCTENLVSPLSSPGSPYSPTSPYASVE